MRVRRALIVLLVPAACALLGDDCGFPDQKALREAAARAAAAAAQAGSGGSVSPDTCLVLSSAMPAGLSLVPGVADRILVADSTPAAVIPVDITTQPPSLATSPAPMITTPGAALEGVTGLGANLALAADQGNEQVLFVDSASGALVNGSVGGATQNGISTARSVTFPAGALDSDGTTVPATPSTTSVTSGAAVSQGLLFVSMANGLWSSGADPLYLPGTVLVYDLDTSGAAPSNSGNPPQAIFTVGYGPSDVTPYTSVGGRHFVLVTTSGAIGLANVTRLDFATSASAAARAGYVEVIEIYPSANPALVAVIPLGERAPAFGRIAIDPSGRVGALGSLIGVAGGGTTKARRVLAVDLGVLDTLPTTAPSTPVVLDGSGGNANAVIDDPSLEITPLGNGPSSDVCSGTVVATAWTFDGRLVAAELCDGTLTSWDLDLSNPTPQFSLRKELAAVAPFSLTGTALSTPVDMLVRSGAGAPDIFLLLGLPGGTLCGVASGTL